MNPSIQNDFSYYRRSLNRMKMTKQDHKLTIRDELANKMSLFFAYPTPMMNVVNDATSKFMNEHPNLKDNVTAGLGAMANICQAMVDSRKCVPSISISVTLCFSGICDAVDVFYRRGGLRGSRFESENTNMFCLRAMVGCIILYDHLHPQGAFHKKSPIRVPITHIHTLSLSLLWDGAC